MTIAETYSLLRSVHQLKRRIWWMQVRRDELQACLLPPGLRYDKDLVQTTPEDKLAKYAVEVADLDRDIIKMRRRRAQLIARISQAVDQLTDERDKQIIAGYYFRGLPLRQLEEELHYNYQYISQLKKAAVARLSHLL